MRRLIVIGNGFDLQCGLKSRFDNFMDSLKNNIFTPQMHFNIWNFSENTDLITALLFNSFYRENISVYSLHDNDGCGDTISNIYKSKLNLNESNLWKNVEEFLFEILTNKEYPLIEEFKKYNKRPKWDDYFICLNDGIPDLIYSIVKKYKEPLSNEEIVSLLVEEVKKFEKKFCSYLLQELNNNQYYYKNSDAIIDKLTKKSKTGTILNFNYTEISCPPSFDSINVHGTLSENLIIGIDASKNENKLLIPFTKTFRKMISCSNPKYINGKYDEILFYGHSLGPQDYSYFQSIFDIVDIYSSQCTIKFIYSTNFDHAGDFKVDYAEKIFNLLDSYSKTLQNENRGKNLVHKLILEGRLQIVEDNFIDYN